MLVQPNVARGEKKLNSIQHTFLFVAIYDCVEGVGWEGERWSWLLAQVNCTAVCLWFSDCLMTIEEWLVVNSNQKPSATTQIGNNKNKKNKENSEGNKRHWLTLNASDWQSFIHSASIHTYTLTYTNTHTYTHIELQALLHSLVNKQCVHLAHFFTALFSL